MEEEEEEDEEPVQAEREEEERPLLLLDLMCWLVALLIFLFAQGLLFGIQVDPVRCERSKCFGCPDVGLVVEDLTRRC